MPNSTCRLLSNGYKFDLRYGGLELRPCCQFDMPMEISNDNDFQQKLESYREMLNNIDSYSSKHCGNCNFLNKHNLRKSWRDLSFDIVPDDAELGDSSYLELQFDKTCNGGCITCGPWYSTFWQNETKDFIQIKDSNQIDPLEKILSIIDVQKIRKILFLGGEPFLTDTDERILRLINNPELVDLQYTTNGSIYPNQTRIDLWKPFRSVLINFSIDSIGKKFDYIRYPLKWDKVLNNMVTMKNQFPNNVKFKMNHTINILNLYYYNEFDEWKSANFSHDQFNRPIVHSFSPASGILNPFEIPSALYKLIVDKYPLDSKVVKVIQNYNYNKSKSVTDYLNQLDQRRNLNWKEVFPEISHCL